LPEAIEAIVESLNDADFAFERTAASHEAYPWQRHRRHEPVQRRRPVRSPERPAAQRLDQAGHRPDVGPVELLEQTIGRLRQTQAERRANVAIPGSEQHIAKALPLTL